ncbi:hypothetical protein Y032_0027g1620 [Ancylostoma ceylanicum]|uniref:Phlebovirus glycoprotein G2 fusion domain-containing protein n=1 Tax=Ancylostoma ceylanicum TaxID=53326 RepID=A0A016UT81_9BILA|nr:hypothetical protein Y032_0027g1620 [Ancylostoma ceylanicum]
MISPSFVFLTCLVAFCSAKHRYARTTRATNLAEWRTTECTVLNGEHTEPCPSPGSNGEWPCISGGQKNYNKWFFGKTTLRTTLEIERTVECAETKHTQLRYSDLCNGQRDCPNGEDESPTHCHIHQLHRAELDAIREKIHRMTVEFNRRTSKSL